MRRLRNQGSSRFFDWVVSRWCWISFRPEEDICKRPLPAKSSHSANGSKGSNELKCEHEILLERPISSVIRHWLLESTLLPSIEKAYCHSEKLHRWLDGI